MQRYVKNFKKTNLIRYLYKNKLNDMGKKIKDSDILKAMAMHLDEESVVYGANGHYAVGAYQDITKVSSVFGDKDYNSQSNLESASGTTAAEKYYTNNGEFDENLQKAEWLKNW